MADGADGRIDMDVRTQATSYEADGTVETFANRIQIKAGRDAAKVTISGAGRLRRTVSADHRERRLMLWEIEQEMKRTAAYDRPVTSFFKAEKIAAELDDPEEIVACPKCQGEWGDCEACFGDGVMTARQAAGVG